MTNGSGTRAAMDPTADPKKVTVWITPGATLNDPPTVSPATPITLYVKSSPKNPKKIKWECTDSNAKFNVEFRSGTPFDQSDYGNTNSESSEPRHGCAEKTPYKYSVSVNGGTPLDPDVIIDR